MARRIVLFQVLERVAVCVCERLHCRVQCRGDPFNEDFRFASFFPEVMQPPVDKVAQVIGTALRLAPRSPTRAPDGFVPGTAPLPGSDDADAARRRCAPFVDFRS